MKSQLIDVGGRKIGVHIYGDSFPIVCLSGFGCDYYIYDDLGKLLENDFKLIVIDNRGTGISDPTLCEYEISDLALDAQTALKELSIAQYFLVGISMGGFIAQELYRIDEKKIIGLSLLCTLSNHKDFIHPLALTEEGLRLFDQYDLKTKATYSTMATTHPELALNSPEIFNHIIEMRMNHVVSLDELIRQNKAAVKFLESTFDLKSIQVPTLIMAGENDRFVNPLNVDIFCQHIKGAINFIVSKADHYFFMERPEVVASKLKEFFFKILKERM